MEEEIYLSDDSSFYGNGEHKAKLQERVDTFDAQAWWEERTPSMEEIALANKAKTAACDAETGTAKLYNPYQGMSCARQLDESVDEFLERLPPATSPISHKLSWIFIANPFIPCKSRRKELERPETGDRQIIAEAPPEDESKLVDFEVQGRRVLRELEETMARLKAEMSGKAPSLLTTAINKERDMAVKKIKNLAMTCHITSGKWMLFPSPHLVNETWSLIAAHTAANSLGIAAKVSPYNAEADPHNREDRLICIYTKDFSDEGDVLRVLKQLRQLRLVEAKGRPIYYKMDAYTYLDIKAGNPWGIRASLWSSADMLKTLDKKT